MTVCLNVGVKSVYTEGFLSVTALADNSRSITDELKLYDTIRRNDTTRHETIKRYDTIFQSNDTILVLTSSRAYRSVSTYCTANKLLQSQVQSRLKSFHVIACK